MACSPTKFWQSVLATSCDFRDGHFPDDDSWNNPTDHPASSGSSKYNNY